MPEIKPSKSNKPVKPSQPERSATHHGLEEYEEVFRRTGNPYQSFRPDWPQGEGDDKSQR